MMREMAPRIAVLRGLERSVLFAERAAMSSKVLAYCKNIIPSIPVRIPFPVVIDAAHDLTRNETQ